MSRVWAIRTISPRTVWLAAFSGRPTRSVSYSRSVQYRRVAWGSRAAEPRIVATNVPEAMNAILNRRVRRR